MAVINSLDLKLGVRMLVKSPGLTAIGVVALAVAIACGAAYFEFFNEFFNPPFRLAGGERLAGIVDFEQIKDVIDGRSERTLESLRANLKTIQELGVAREVARNLITGDGRSDVVRDVEISASAFRLMAVPPLHGRPLVDDDEKPGAAPVAVIGYSIWRSRFAGDPAAVGRSVRLGAIPHTIVGVMPESFGFPLNHDFWTPLKPGTVPPKDEGYRLRVFGRLAPGADFAAARAEVGAIAAAAPKAADGSPRPVPDVLPYVRSLWQRILWQVRVLYLVNVFFVALLGICAANVATLVFARTATRESEITVRTALGASRGRIVSQLVAEAFVLSAIAAGVGLAVASSVMGVAKNVWMNAQQEPMPFWWNESLGFDTILYTGLLVIVASLLVGGIPALKATSRDMQDRLKQAGSSGGTMQFGTFWTGIIVSQVALTVIFLLCTASFAWELTRSQRQFSAVSFPRQQYLTAGVDLPEATPARRRAALHELKKRLQESPAVVGVTFSNGLPAFSGLSFEPEFAQPEVASSATPSGDVLTFDSQRVGSDYFETFNQPLMAGRLFTEGEIESGQNVAIVDQTFVRLVLGGRSAVGLQLRERKTREGGKPGPWIEIVGVVSDVSHAPNKRTEDGLLYRPLETGERGGARVVIRTSGDPATVITPLRNAAVAVDPELRLSDVLPLERVTESEEQTIAFLTEGMLAVGAVAVLLSTAGIYALIAFTLTRRTREIAIRAALGAAPQRILTAILSRSFVQVLSGVVLGSVPGGALFLAMAETGDVSPGLAVATAAVIGMSVLAVAMIACVPPVQRALRIQPMDALRAD